MRLNLHDASLQATLRLVGEHRTRLTLEYPSDSEYRELVMSALAEILRPASAVGRSSAPAEAAR